MRPHRSCWSPGVPVMWMHCDDTSRNGFVVEDWGDWNVTVRLDDNSVKQIDYRQIRGRWS